MQIARRPNQRRSRAYALPELLICLVVMMLVYGGSILCYILVANRAQWSGYSLAAQALSIQNQFAGSWLIQPPA